MDTLSGGKGLHGEMYLQVEVYTIFDYFKRINESINFVTV